MTTTNDEYNESISAQVGTSILDANAKLIDRYIPDNVPNVKVIFTKAGVVGDFFISIR